MMASQRYLICLFLFFTHNASSADEEWQNCIYKGTMSFYKQETEACCQGSILQRSPLISEEICCGDRLYDSTSGVCCGSRTWYNPDTHMCCNSEVFPLTEQTECCDNGLIATTTHTCCYGRLVEGVGKCCGNSATYDPSTQHCCVGPDMAGHVYTVGREGGLLECCGTEVINTRLELCCRGISTERLTPFTECCGLGTFDTRTDVCCESWPNQYRVSPLVNGRIECCGLTPYNKDNDQCCQSQVTHDIGNGRCCGSVAYNPLRSSCCNPYGNDPVSLTIPEIPGVKDCCGGESYLKTQQVCCSDTLHDLQPGRECCGTDLYDPSDSLCCGGRVLDRPSSTSQCCGNAATFDPAQQTCCSGHVFNSPNGACCRTARDQYQAYNPDTSKCCERHKLWGPTYGRVHSNDTKCCGIFELSDDQLCNPCTKKGVGKRSQDHNAVCCYKGNYITFNKTISRCNRRNGRVFRRRVLQPGQALCGVHVFSTATHQCCNQWVNTKTYEADKSYPTKCCGIESYNPEWHSCLRDVKVIQGIPESVMSECRGNAFNNQTHACYQNLLILPLEEMEEELEVCYNRKAERGFYLYSPEEKECCRDTLIGPGYTCCAGRPFETPGTGVGQGRCCDQAGYNPATHMCCNDEVLHELTAEGQVCCGRQLYDPSEEAGTCCNGTLYPSEGGRTECTDGVAHRPAETVCDGVIHPVNNGRCCGKVLMNTDLHICCQDKFLYEKHFHGDTCCGRVAYDSSNPTEKCCMDSLFHDAQHSACCQGQLMNPFTDTCKAVGDVTYTFPRNKSVFFCSEGTYDSSRQTCCGGLLYDFPGTCCGNEVLPTGQDKDVMCCGGKKQINSFGTNALCCKGHVWYDKQFSCCGGAPLNKHHTWLTCCDGVIKGKRKCRADQSRRRQPSDLTLCGGQAYNPSLQGCCNGSRYNSEQYGCLDNLLKPLCGGIPYESTSLLCCSGTTHDASTTGCCDGTAYDLSKHTCCDGQLSRVRNGACCGANSSVPYNRNRHLCCGGRLRKRKNGRTECCGSSAYNPKADTCCGSKANRGISHGTCCGDRAFDPTKRMCCPETGMLYRRRLGLEFILQGCCAPGMEYNASSGTCIPQVCEMCGDLQSTDGWKQHLHKPTLIRGTTVNVTANAAHHVVHLTRVRHLNHNKRQSRLDSQELSVAIPAHCGCYQQFQLDKAYVIMSDAVVTGGQDLATLLLRPTDFLARARNKLGAKITRRLCTHH